MDKNRKASLQKFQNRGMRIILRCNRYTPINMMLSCLEWQPVELRLKYFTMVFIYKILNKHLPPYLLSNITYNNEVHDHLTRGRDNMHITRTKNKKSMNCLFFKGLNEYNKLPTEVKNCDMLNAFKIKLRKFLICV